MVQMEPSRALYRFAGALEPLLAAPDAAAFERAWDGAHLDRLAWEALALARRERPDVVVTDIEMPEMNGFEFAEAIRADQHLHHLPIIAVSSLISPAAIERGRQAGFHDYVAKFDRPGLIAALKEQTAEMKRAA